MSRRRVAFAPSHPGGGTACRDPPQAGLSRLAVGGHGLAGNGSGLAVVANREIGAVAVEWIGTVSQRLGWASRLLKRRRTRETTSFPHKSASLGHDPLWDGSNRRPNR